MLFASRKRRKGNLDEHLLLMNSCLCFVNLCSDTPSCIVINSDKSLTHTKTCDTRHSSRSSIIPSRKIDLFRKITLCSLLYIMRWQILPSLVIMVTCYALQFQATTPPQPRSDFSSTNCNPHISGNTTRQNHTYIHLFLPCQASPNLQF